MHAHTHTMSVPFYYHRGADGEERREEVEEGAGEEDPVAWVGWRSPLYGMMTMTFAFVCTMTQISSADPMGHLSQWYYYLSLASFMLMYLATFHHSMRLVCFELSLFMLGSFAFWAWETALLVALFGKQITAYNKHQAETHDCPPLTGEQKLFYIPTLYEMRFCNIGDLGVLLTLTFSHFSPVALFTCVFVPQYRLGLVDYFRRTWRALARHTGMRVAYVLMQLAAPLIFSLVYKAIYGDVYGQYGVQDAAAWKQWLASVSGPVALWGAQGALVLYLRSWRKVRVFRARG